MDVQFQDEHLGMLAKQQKQHGKTKFPAEVVKSYKRRLAQISAAKDTQDLRAIGSLHFEKLSEKKYEGKYSIRINKAYRLIFQILKDNLVEIILVEEITNHYS